MNNEPNSEVGDEGDQPSPEEQTELLREQNEDLKRTVGEMQEQLESATQALTDPEILDALAMVKRNRAGGQSSPQGQPAQPAPTPPTGEGTKAASGLSVQDLTAVMGQFGQNLMQGVTAQLATYGQVNDVKESLIEEGAVTRADWRELYAPAMQGIATAHPTLGVRKLYDMAHDELLKSGKVKPKDSQPKNPSKFTLSHRPDENARAPGKVKSYSKPKVGGGKNVDMTKHIKDAMSDMGLNTSE